MYFYLFFSPQEALSIYKEAVHKMPRQFAPQSLFNMMGELPEEAFSIATPDCNSTVVFKCNYYGDTCFEM